MGIIPYCVATQTVYKKKLKYKWRRFRECIKSCQDPAVYECFDIAQQPYMVSQLCWYMLMEEAGKLKIYYADESGFSLEPCIPYGWQPADEYVRITPAGGKRMNVFGLLSRDNDLHAFSTLETVNTEMVIACIDEFVKTIRQKTVIVLDNASIHKSEPFNGSTMLTNHAKLGEWIRKGLRIFHLPPYSPHLNIIETLWRKMKYQWLKPEDYASWDTLQKAVEKILISVGKDLKINFGELKHFSEFKANKAAINYG